jgi:hypothetical protein
MQVIAISAVLGFLIASVSAQCACSHNNDAGRWVDGGNSPASDAFTLINNGGGCFTAATQGVMCISFNNPTQDIKNCLGQEAANQQSQHGDWFLWSAITCTDGSATAQLTITT